MIGMEESIGTVSDKTRNADSPRLFLLGKYFDIQTRLHEIGQTIGTDVRMSHLSWRFLTKLSGNLHAAIVDRCIYFPMVNLGCVQNLPYSSISCAWLASTHMSFAIEQPVSEL